MKLLGNIRLIDKMAVTFVMLALAATLLRGCFK